MISSCLFLRHNYLDLLRLGIDLPPILTLALLPALNSLQHATLPHPLNPPWRKLVAVKQDMVVRQRLNHSLWTGLVTC
jgi:hypothetical protein